MEENQNHIEGKRRVDNNDSGRPIREREEIELAIAGLRRDWIRNHLSYIFAVIGIILVAAIVVFIVFYFRNNNPLSTFESALSKDFGTSFAFEADLIQDDESVMRYDGAISVDRSRQQIEAQYQADYQSYSFTGALYADEKTAVKGNYYDEKWTVQDCTDMVRDFFDFDREFRNGEFNAGAFLRFTGLTSEYSPIETDRLIETLKKRLSTDSSIATITTEKVDGGTRYNYELDLYEVLNEVKENGASVFCRATDYDRFVKTFELNQSNVKNAKCTIWFEVNDSGYLTSFDGKVIIGEKDYGLSCRMSRFGEAKVELPEGFADAAKITPNEE